ncbi:hypothetical protein J7K25_04730 [bacterium]|nr:hypothetical protein [bacterium]
MIKNRKIIEEFENNFKRQNPLSIEEKLEIYQEMWNWAKNFRNRNKKNKKNIEEEIKHKITLAKILNKIK